MIRVDRTPEPAPRILTDGTSRSKPERERVLSSWENWRQRNPTADPVEFGFNFKAYKAAEVKKALTRLFHAKCAYCETYYGASQPMDVEHWRPKGEVHEGETKLGGYWWLASDWENLYPSCIDCNRGRKHRVPGERMIFLLGKENQFPIAGPRAVDRAGLAAEQPLLLDPCDPNDDPERHFRYVETDGAIEPADPNDRKAAESIRVYALNRMGLAVDRLHVIEAIRQRIKVIRTLLDLLDGENLSPRIDAALKYLLHGEARALLAMKRPERPYAGLARYMIDEFARREGFVVGDAAPDT